ncbi:hypothetical protein BZK32_21080 [Escherichia coli]|nr:hypothetical protein BZK32_21080 [Escherichia coli]
MSRIRSAPSEPCVWLADGSLGIFGIHCSVYYTQVKRPVNVQRIELRSRVRAFHALRRGAPGNQSDVAPEWR